MNDADRKAFDMWWEYGKGNHGEQFDAWKAACEWRDSQNQQLIEALEGVIRVADRATIEFDAARAAIAKAKGEQTK